ncbi:MAG: replication protein [Oscillospiraceae bacterium]|jgi:hypothetical protein|nr:replication protein [Oscillospiraceae bacterium]
MDKKTKIRVFTFTVDAENPDYPNQAENIISEMKSVPRYAYVLHDKDVDIATGEVKKPHYHFYLEYLNPRYVSSIAKEFGLPEHMVEIVRHKKGALSYLLHRTAKAIGEGKYQYDIEELHTNIEDFDFEAVSNGDSIDYLSLFVQAETLQECHTSLIKNGEDFSTLIQFSRFVSTYKAVKDVTRNELQKKNASEDVQYPTYFIGHSVPDDVSF